MARKEKPESTNKRRAESVVSLTSSIGEEVRGMGERFVEQLIQKILLFLHLELLLVVAIKDAGIMT